MDLTTSATAPSRITIATETSAVIHEKPPRAPAVTVAIGSDSEGDAPGLDLAASAFLSTSSWKRLICLRSSSGTSGRGSDGRCESSASEAAHWVGLPQSGHLSSGG